MSTQVAILCQMISVLSTPNRYLCQFVPMWSSQGISPTRVRATDQSKLVFRKLTWPRSNPESEVPIHHCYIRSYPEYLEAASSIPTLNTQHDIVTTASWVCRHTGAHQNGTLLHWVLASLLQLLLQHRCVLQGSCDAEQANSTFKQHEEDYSLQTKLCDELRVPRSNYSNDPN